MPNIIVFCFTYMKRKQRSEQLRNDNTVTTLLQIQKEFIFKHDCKYYYFQNSFNKLFYLRSSCFETGHKLCTIPG